MNIIIITQARFGSSRLPGKVLKKIDDTSLLALHLRRLKKVGNVSAIIVATTNEPESDMITAVAKSEDCLYYKGSTEDVLDRFYNAAQLINSSYVVRVTSDCPLIDHILVSKAIQYTLDNSFTYCMLSEQFPDGVDVEVFRTEELTDAYLNAKLPSEREHVTPYIRNKSKFNGTYGQYECEEGDFKTIRFTVDEEDDYKAIERLISNLGAERGWKEYANFIKNNPSMFKNQELIRNAGYSKSLLDDKSS